MSDRARRWISVARWVVNISLFIGVVVYGEGLPYPDSGLLFGATIVVMGVVGGERGVRFAVPFGIAVMGYWSAAGAELYTSFYANAAQVIPVLLLALAIEQRAALRDEVRSVGHGHAAAGDALLLAPGRGLRAVGSRDM